MYFCHLFFQFMFGVPKPEEDTALKRMLGETVVV